VVISLGALQVRPSSRLEQTHAVRVPVAVPCTIAASRSSPRLWVSNNQTVPVTRSNTAQGLPQVFPPSSHTTWLGPQVRPPSLLRLSSKSTSALSLALARRPSQNASSAPDGVRSSAGIR